MREGFVLKRIVYCEALCIEADASAACIGAISGCAKSRSARCKSGLARYVEEQKAIRRQESTLAAARQSASEGTYSQPATQAAV